ncbi:MAG: TonB-dependent receptor plug domain-containing protein, partial [Novosphingobium sp.]|nr:TonB-dependent receptor plug domain-containing protein [Novosphingobium sp.]
MPVPASAAEEPVQEIVVTARRIDERMADVPLAVDLIPGNVVATGGIDGLQSLAAHVPGLSFEAAWGGWNSFPVLRGQNQPSVAGDNVGMFVDGVYQANRDAIDVEPLDLDRIEVVRGPQSALFGHSTFAGLISYVPAGPTETLQVKGAADAGTHNLRGVSGAISGPINDEFKGRLAASWRQADGTWENAAAPGQHLGNARDLAIAGTIATRDGSGSLSMRLSGRHGESRANQPAFFTLDYRSYNCGARDATSGAWSYFCGAAPIPAQVAVSPDLPDSRTHSDQLALHLALDLEAIELLSESSIYGAASSIYRDLDGSPQGDLYG